jgi:uncharacterized protein (TIGR00369 family)
VTDEQTLQRYLDEAPLHALMGALAVRSLEEGVRIEGTLYSSVENGAGTGTAHGGALATLLDTALTFAVIAATDRDWATVDLRMDYLRAVGLGEVQVDARALHVGRRTARAEGELMDGSGTVCARAVGTFLPT